MELCQIVGMESTHNLTQFRQQVYQNFNKRADVLMDALDALCSQTGARSVVELSLESCFRRQYTALFKGIAEYRPAEQHLAQMGAEHLPSRRRRSFWLLGVDVTSQPRLYAQTLKERAIVHRPTVIRGNKPITIGHQYSTVALLPEKDPDNPVPWVVPLSCRRIKTDERKALVGAEQIGALLSNKTLPFHGELTVEVGDSDYSQPAYLVANREHENLVTVVRCRSNRVLYRQERRSAAQTGGAPRHYGPAFRLRHPDTWHEPDAAIEMPFTSRRGHQYTVVIQAWHNMLMRGRRKPKPLRMYEHPFTLVRIVLLDEDGQPAFKRPLWLLVVGERRHELSLADVYQAYTQRSDLEHFFRFGKQRLLLDKFQSTELEREEAWWQFVHLAYLQLWVARPATTNTPRPWEKYLPHHKQGKSTPSLVQRDFGRLIRTFGTPAKAPKPRGKSPGRKKGFRLPPRERQKVLRKGAKPTS